MPAPTLPEHFEEQAQWCDRLGSPFTAALLRAMRLDLKNHGVIEDLVGDWPGNPRADALGLRLAGALHFGVLSGMSAPLASVYPEGQIFRPMEEVWAVASAFLKTNADWVRTFLQMPPQTNETRRAFMLLIGLKAIAKRFERPIHFLELGASAGLNQNFDAFFYEAGDWHWGEPSSDMKVSTTWTGPAPDLSAPLVLHERKACDQNPLDLSDEETRLRLKSYIWADQPERLSRFDAAADLAIARNTQVDRADAALWLARELKSRPSGVTTVIFHSVFFQYPPLETRQRITRLIEDEARFATDASPIVWLRYEPEILWNRNAPPLALGMTCDMRVWPGDEHVTLARSDGHVREVQAL